MKVAVWDTYVKKEDGNIMHFDILVPDNLTNEQTIFNFGKDYLNTKTFQQLHYLQMNVVCAILSRQQKK